MANNIKKNLVKGSFAGLSTCIATFLVYGGGAVAKTFGIDIDDTAKATIVVALSGILIGISDAIKHRK